MFVRKKKNWEGTISVVVVDKSNRGYNKFLEIAKDIGVTINEEKIAEDALWEGW